MKSIKIIYKAKKKQLLDKDHIAALKQYYYWKNIKKN